MHCILLCGKKNLLYGKNLLFGKILLCGNILLCGKIQNFGGEADLHFNEAETEGLV